MTGILFNDNLCNIFLAVLKKKKKKKKKKKNAYCLDGAYRCSNKVEYGYLH